MPCRPAAILWALLCGADAWSQARIDAVPLSEDRLLEYATAPFDLMLFHASPFVLGSLGGVDVVVSSSCSDLCPDYTTRIIHFDVPAGQSCADIGGVERSQDLGGWGGKLTRCFPRVISDHWEDYINVRRGPWVSPVCEGRQGQVIESREESMTCPEQLPIYVSLTDLTIRPTALHEQFVSVVGFVSGNRRRWALLVPGREEVNGIPLRNPERLTIAPPCLNQPVRVTGTFHASPEPEIVVAQVLMEETYVRLYGCERR